MNLATFTLIHVLISLVCEIASKSDPIHLGM